jgi:hypothetical protein
MMEDEDGEGKHLLIGFNRNANLIELLYNVIDDNTVRVFHALPCRNTFIRLLDKEG